MGLAFFAQRILTPRAHALQGLSGAPLGQTCFSTEGCLQVQGCDVSGAVICADNGIADDGALTCCLEEDGFCGADRHCCGELLCMGRGGDGCGAGRCRPPGWTEENASTESLSTCEGYITSTLAQLTPDIVWSLLASWGETTPEALALPDTCPWPVLPPESPWCIEDYCVDYVPVVHSENGAQFCYFRDPYYSAFPGVGIAEWICVPVFIT